MNYLSTATTVTMLLLSNLVFADNENYPGYLGVYVVEADDGMEITGFIRDTPAARLADDDEIHKGDTIVKLAGQETPSLAKLQKARNSIKLGDEAKMVLETPSGSRCHVWISRSEATADAPKPPDHFKYGGKGEGNGPDVRRKKANDRDDEGDVRRKRR